MSTGISMSSVNKIKELADNGDYSLALDILEHQDLSKSLSPQFIRICGEVYYENGCYSEARGALVRAHSMAPAGNKIIYSLIKLYLSMGFRSLAEHYFDIYRFNQDKKDAGTYRIEYMIAKAHHKPVNELYSILVSANDIETSEEWDYEMLLLHAYIRNADKFDAAAEEFRAKYRNSARLSVLDKLLGSDCDLESMIYAFPCEEKVDDAPEQKIIREQEKMILAEDDLKIHPKDAKIMIMVEDDAPVTSSMKLKQIWIRSKDKKEHKKELKREESEEDKKEKKKSRTFFGIMSRKDEELVDKEMQDIQSEDFDREKLLDEVVAGSENNDENTNAEIENRDVNRNTGLESNENDDNIAVEIITDSKSNAEDKTEDVVQDMTEQSHEEMSAEESAVYNMEPEDSFVIEEEPEDVVMVDAALVDTVVTESNDDESIKLGGNDSDVQEETFDPEFDEEDNDTFFAAEDEKNEEYKVPDEQFDFDKAFESLEEFDVEDDDFDIVELADDVEDLEDTEDITGAEEFEDTEDFDRAERVDEIEDFDRVERVDEEIEDIVNDTGSSGENYPVDDKDEHIEDAEDTQSEDIDIEKTDKILEPLYNSNLSDKTKYSDFPVFKSSLFPDYNTEGAKLYDVGGRKTPKIEADEAEISKNLQKEEDLLGETDRLLARLGIKFETEFKSILNFDEDGSEDIKSGDDLKENNSDEESVKKESEDMGHIAERSDGGNSDDKESSNNEKRHKKNENKSFKLKGK